MKLVLFITTGLQTGGAERMLHQLALRLPSFGYSVEVIQLGSGGYFQEALKDRGVAVTDLQLTKSWYDLTRLPKLLRETRLLKPDLVQGWMYHGNIAATLAVTAPEKPTALAWSIRQTLYSLRNEKMSTTLVIKLGAILSKFPRSIIYNSALSATQHSAIGYSEKNAIVIPNGFDTTRFAPSEEKRFAIRRLLGISETEFLVGMIARFHPMKDFASFASAAEIFSRDVPCARFLLAGPGVSENNDKLVELLRNSGIASKTLLLGERRDSEIVLNALDLATLTSAWGESFSNSLGEAMSTGIPVVATNIGGASLLLKTTPFLLCPPKDPRSLAQAWRAVYELDDGKYTNICSLLRATIEREFSINSVVPMYANLYDQILGPQ